MNRVTKKTLVDAWADVVALCADTKHFGAVPRNGLQALGCENVRDFLYRPDDRYVAPEVRSIITRQRGLCLLAALREACSQELGRSVSAQDDRLFQPLVDCLGASPVSL